MMTLCFLHWYSVDVSVTWCMRCLLCQDWVYEWSRSVRWMRKWEVANIVKECAASKNNYKTINPKVSLLWQFKVEATLQCFCIDKMLHSQIMKKKTKIDWKALKCGTIFSRFWVYGVSVSLHVASRNLPKIMAGALLCFQLYQIHSAQIYAKQTTWVCT